jgi:hypothetical protein
VKSKASWLAIWAVMVLMIVLSGCSAFAGPSPTPTPVPNSGIDGQVLIGPQCPVERPGDPNCADKPYQATVIVENADGSHEITRFTSGADGRFRVALEPATYLLNPQSKTSPFPRGVPQIVTVEAGRYSQITISYDTGIR